MQFQQWLCFFCSKSQIINNSITQRFENSYNIDNAVHAEVFMADETPY